MPSTSPLVYRRYHTSLSHRSASHEWLLLVKWRQVTHRHIDTSKTGYWIAFQISLASIMALDAFFLGKRPNLTRHLHCHARHADDSHFPLWNIWVCVKKNLRELCALNPSIWVYGVSPCETINMIYNCLWYLLCIMGLCYWFYTTLGVEAFFFWE